MISISGIVGNVLIKNQWQARTTTQKKVVKNHR